MDNGYESSRSWPYTFGTFRTGEPIPKELRVWYRKFPEQWSKYGDPFESSELKRKAAVINLSKKQYLSFLARLARKFRIVDF